MAKSKYIEADGQFKPVNGSRFDGCVEYQMKIKGLRKENAEKLCGYIARKAGKMSSDGG
jgi:hypothetical protein|tara:strand:- start:931 stop:1107 length:177 start_codon:yes stop_codon:yes gene_type:complete